MNRVVLLSMLVVLSASAAERDDVVISSGPKGGAYYGIASQLSAVLRHQHQVPTRVLTSAGSMENLNRLGLAGSDVNLALSQADALDQFVRQTPTAGKKLHALASVGRECAFLITRTQGPIETASQLKAPGDRAISIVDTLSGGAITWQNLNRLQPDFGNTLPLYVDVMESLLLMRNPPDPENALAATLFVQRPLRRSPALEEAYQNPEVYRFVPITAEDIPNLADAMLPDGSPVYTIESVAIGGKSRDGATHVETLCTRGLLVANPEKLSKELRGLLAQLVLADAAEIFGRDE